MEVGKHEVLFRVLEYMARHETSTCSRLVTELHYHPKRVASALKHAQSQEWCQPTYGDAWELTLLGCIKIGLELSERNTDEHEPSSDDAGLGEDCNPGD